jgi:hypothetical protein
MSKVIVNNSVTLDGVMQAPARADEDLRDGFEYGGWAQPYFDEVMVSVAAEGSLRVGTCCSDDGRTRTSRPCGPTCRRRTRSPP